MIDSLAPWVSFLSRQAVAPPLTFVLGMRNHPEPGFWCSMHHHESIEIVYHPTGRGVTKLEAGGSIDFEEGDIIIYAPREEHDQLIHCEGEDFCVQLAVPKGRRGVPKSGFHVRDVKDALVLDQIRQLSRSHVRVSMEEQVIFNLRATATLHALVHLARQRQEDVAASGIHHVLRAAKYIREHFDTLQSLTEVAEHVGLSPDHLRHAFKAHHGCSLVAYLNEVRMDRARLLLVHSREPLKEIATRCGFADEYYFSAVFRKATGMPPGRYRRQTS